MSDYKIGYGKPPAAYQFKKGTSGNNKGRPRRSAPEPSPLAAIILGAINEPIEYRTRDGTKTATGRELDLNLLVKRAIDGDLDATAAVLSELMEATRTGSTEIEHFEIIDWIEDHPGQTADEKTQDYQAKMAAPRAWGKADRPSGNTSDGNEK